MDTTPLQNRVTAVEPGDYPRLVEVWEAAVRASHHFLTDADVAYFKPLVRDRYLYLVDLACVRDHGGRVVGFVGVAEDKMEMLFVDPAWHGRGAGRCLVEHAVGQMGAHLVDVNEQNEQAVAFYLRMGFEVFDRSELDSLGKPFPLLHLRVGEGWRTSG